MRSFRAGLRSISSARASPAAPRASVRYDRRSPRFSFWMVMRDRPSRGGLNRWPRVATQEASIRELALFRLKALLDQIETGGRQLVPPVEQYNG